MFQVLVPGCNQCELPPVIAQGYTLRRFYSSVSARGNQWVGERIRIIRWLV